MPLGTTKIRSVWVVRAPWRQPLSSTGPPPWPNSPSVPRHEATQGMRLASCIPSLARRPAAVALCWCVSPRPQTLALAPVLKKLTASINDSYILSGGCTASLCNFTKVTFGAISKTHSYLISTSRQRPCSPSLPTRSSLTEW